MMKFKQNLFILLVRVCIGANAHMDYMDDNITNGTEDNELLTLEKPILSGNSTRTKRFLPLSIFNKAYNSTSSPTAQNPELDNTAVTFAPNLEGTVDILHAPPDTTNITQVVLECAFIGKPAPTVQWLKNGELIAGNEVKNYMTPPADPNGSGLVQVVSELHLKSSSKGDIFTCVGSSGLNQKNSSTTIFADEGTEDELPVEGIFIFYYIVCILLSIILLCLIYLVTYLRAPRCNKVSSPTMVYYTKIPSPSSGCGEVKFIIR